MNGGATTVAVTHSNFGTLLPDPRPLVFVGLKSGNGGGRNEYTTTFNRANPAVAPLLDAWTAVPFTVIQRVMSTCTSEGYARISLAVLQKSPDTQLSQN